MRICTVVHQTDRTALNCDICGRKMRGAIGMRLRPTLPPLAQKTDMTTEDLALAFASSFDPTQRKMAAASELVTDDILRELVTDPDPGVRATIAARPTPLPADILAALAGDEDASIRGRVAQRADTPMNVLNELAGDGNTTVRAAAARNTRIGADTLTIAVRAYQPPAYLASGQKHPLLAILNHPDMTAPLLSELVERVNDDTYLLEIARHQKATPHVLSAIAHQHTQKRERRYGPPTEDKSARKYVASHPELRTEDMAALAQDVDLAAHVMKNPNAPEALIRQMIELDTYDVLRAAAQRPERWAAELAIDSARDYVTRRKTWSTSIDQRIHYEGNRDAILGAAAKNPVFTDDDLWEMWASHPRADAIITGIAANPSAGEDLLTKLCDDFDDTTIEHALAGNPATPSGVMARLARSQSSVVKKAAAQHDNTPPEALKRLAMLKNDDVAIAALNNPRMPGETLTAALGGTPTRAAAAEQAITTWMHTHLGISPDNHRARERLVKMAWWTFTPESREVQAITRVFRD